MDIGYACEDPWESATKCEDTTIASPSQLPKVWATVETIGTDSAMPERHIVLTFRKRATAFLATERLYEALFAKTVEAPGNSKCEWHYRYDESLHIGRIRGNGLSIRIWAKDIDPSRYVVRVTSTDTRTGYIEERTESTPSSGTILDAIALLNSKKPVAEAPQMIGKDPWNDSFIANTGDKVVIGKIEQEWEDNSPAQELDEAFIEGIASALLHNSK